MLTQGAPDYLSRGADGKLRHGSPNPLAAKIFADSDGPSRQRDRPLITTPAPASPRLTAPAPPNCQQPRLPFDQLRHRRQKRDPLSGCGQAVVSPAGRGRGERGSRQGWAGGRGRTRVGHSSPAPALPAWKEGRGRWGVGR